MRMNSRMIVYRIFIQIFCTLSTCSSSALYHILIGFDEYYKNLLPRMENECNGTEQNVPHHTLKDKMVNCRNVWYREFWSQHHNCTFNRNTSGGLKQCTGQEALRDYEQEGLVPFVGKFLTHLIDIWYNA